MTVAGKERELQQIDVLSELPKLTHAIEDLNGNFVRFMTGMEARQNRIEENAERNDTGMHAIQDGQMAIEAELKRLNANVSRIAQAAVRATSGPDYPWTPEAPKPTPARKPNRRKHDRRQEDFLAKAAQEDVRRDQDELAACFLATLGTSSHRW